MSAYEDLLSAVRYIRDRTGDPNAWQTGLAADELTAALTPTTPSQRLEVILRKIRGQHPDLFRAPAPNGGPADAAAVPSDPGKGDAAEAIARAEAALAQQNSASAQLDMQVISAILNAHLKAVDGAEALTKLQRETEAAVQTRSDLDTPAGARDFQRFLIGKLRDIRAVVLNASLDDTSKSALMAAWTSLYEASRNADGDQPAASANPADATARGTAAPAGDESDTDALLDSLLAEDPGLLAEDSPGPAAGTEGSAVPVTPVAPPMPTFPNIGMGPLPAMSMPSGLPLPGELGGMVDPALRNSDAGLPRADDSGASAHDDSPSEPGENDEDRDEAVPAATPETPPAGPTTVTLPDGETVTAPSPQLAAAIEAAVQGAPIAQAFQQQGIALPPPGTAVAEPIEPAQVNPGDVGIFTDRYALALGPGKALVDGQIQDIATISGPTFLGWEHPPAATATVTTPTESNAPTPTRPATTSTNRE